MTTAPQSAAQPLLGLTLGDPAGVGPELALRALHAASTTDSHRLIVLGDRTIIDRVASGCPELPRWTGAVIELKTPEAPLPELSESTVVHVPTVDLTGVEPGEVSAATGAASFQYVCTAIDAALSGRLDAVVTGPIHKEAWHAAGVDYPGHTELFATRTKADRNCMMLTSAAITCSLVTTHVGLRDVPELLRVDRILEVIRLTATTMQQLLGRSPRLVVCGLNPHAGEQGLFGDGEEQRIIEPAIRAASAEGIECLGPLPPDTAFCPDRRAQTDAYVCMYHDQGLIPLKALAFDTAVNVTLGLPIVRTSVDHGTALDIAWRGIASDSSLNEALRLAGRLAHKNA